MGRRRRQSDDRAGALGEARADADTDRRAICLQRWPGILAAIRALLTAYNNGAGEELLTVSEQSGGDDPAVVVASRGSANGDITISVDGDAFLVTHESGIGRCSQSPRHRPPDRLLAQRFRHGGLSAAGLDGSVVNQMVGRPSGWRHAREITADLLIATALIWIPVLLFGAVVAVVTRLF